MTAVEAGFAAEFLEFLTSIGVGFGDVVILLVLGGFFWLVNKGKLKVGGNGYVQEKEYRTDMKEIKEDIKGMREGVQGIDRRVASMEGRMEQYSK